MKSLLSSGQETQLVNAIVEAEKGTSGEIRVHFDRRCTGDPVAQARKIFVHLGMQHTTHRNAVLIYVALDSRKIAIVGDEGIHQKVSPDFWNSELETIIRHFAEHQFLSGLQKAVSDIGEKLKLFFPSENINQDELPNDITIS